MAWRVPTTEDLIASASAREVEAFQRSASWNGAEPAAELVKQAAGVLRGYMRRGGVRMSPVEGAIPGDLMGPVMDYAVYALCRRMSVPVSKEREAAWRAALEMFRAIGERKMEPEPYDGDGATDGGRVGPRVSDPADKAILG